MKLDYLQLGPFKIKSQYRPVTFKLKLPKGIKIYPVFYKALLELVPQNTKIPENVEINKVSKVKYKVKKILKKKTFRGQVKYLVK